MVNVPNWVQTGDFSEEEVAHLREQAAAGDFTAVGLLHIYYLRLLWIKG